MATKKSFAKKLIDYRKRVFSQTIEDGIIQGIFENIGTSNKYFIEFGAWDGVRFSNTANLRINEGWDGLLLEGNKDKADKLEYVKHAFLTAENINDHFEKHQVPKSFDLLSIDLDGNDYWIWKAIDENRFRPRVVVVEFNCNFPNQKESKAIKYQPELDSTIPSINYYGASIPAFKKLAKSKGYSLIFRVNNHNLFFVDNNLLHDDDIDIPLEMFLNKDCKGIQDSRARKPDQSKNVYGYNDKLLHDVFYGVNMQPHWNKYADTSINIWWPQRFDKDWVII
jgi:hypothetical protein